MAQQHHPIQQIATVTLVNGQGSITTANLTAYGGSQKSYTYKAIHLGDATGLIGCPGSQLASGASTVCKGDRTTGPGDVGADLKLSATASGTPVAGTLAQAKASITITYNALATWTLTSVPSPNSFSAAGQTITFTHTVKNTGNVAISPISVSGAKVGSCSIASLAAGATTTCTSMYVTVAGDVGADISFAATAKGTPAAGSLADATASGTITFTALPALALAVKAAPETFGAPGQTIIYTFTVTNTGNSLSIYIPSVTSSLGQVTFGPEISHRIALGDAAAIEPRVAIQGIWNFAANLHGTSIIDAGAAGEGLRGRLEGGARLSTPGGIMLGFSASYDGLGASGYHATSGRAILRLPLQ